MTSNSNGAAKLLLGVNAVLLCGAAFVLMIILLENSPDLYEWVYNATYKIHPFIIYSWFVAIVLSPVLATALSLIFGAEIRKTIYWKISIAIMVLAGIPSLAFAALIIAMRTL